MEEIGVPLPGGEEAPNPVFSILPILTTPGAPSCGKVSADLPAFPLLKAVHGLRRCDDGVHIGADEPASGAESRAGTGALQIGRASCRERV